MKVGDLVKIKKYCRHGNELAIVVEVPDVINCVKIVLMDRDKTISSLVTNLELIS